MNCRAAQRLISDARDRALAAQERTALEAHVAGCAGCREVRDTLAAAGAAWVARDRALQVPDAERAWHAIRRAKHAGDAAGGRSLGAWWMRALWAGVPVVGAAAIALVVWTGGSQPGAPAEGGTLVRFVEVESASSAPVVIVDEASGWIVVWAGEFDGTQS